MRYAVVPADGPISFRDGEVTLAVLQTLVRGDIEALGLPGAVMYMNEEGKLVGLPTNPIATGLARERIGPGDWIAGDVVVVGPPNRRGDDTALPKKWADRLEALGGS